MKIYEIGTGYTPIPAQMGAATEIVVEELTRSFLKSNESVEIIDISSLDRADTDLPITEVKVPSLFIKKDVSLGIMHKLKRVVYSIALAYKLKKILKAEKSKVILHFHNQYNLFFFSKLVGKRYREKAIIAYTNHSYIWHGEWSEIRDTVKKRYFQEVSAMRYADIVFVLNSNTKKNITEYCNVSADKVCLTKNGVNTRVYLPMDDESVRSYKADCQLQDKKIFIQVGSVCPRKNQLGAIKLLLPFMLSDNDIVFCYAGGIIDEEYQKQIIEFSVQNGIEQRVRYFGELKPGSQLNEFYNMALAMIFPSTAEGFSLTVIEAMAAGVPVVVPKALDFELSNECLVFGNEGEFGEIIDIINSDIDGETRKKARRSVEAEYSWEKIAEKHLEIFKLFEGEGNNA